MHSQNEVRNYEHIKSVIEKHGMKGKPELIRRDIRKIKPDDGDAFHNFLYDYVVVAQEREDPKFEEIFKLILLEEFEKELDFFYVTMIAMQIEGVHDLLYMDFKGKRPLDDNEGNEEEEDEETIFHDEEQTAPPADPIFKFMRDIYWHAKHDIPLLIVGETGTGKESMAKVIHTISARRLKPFCEINCAAIPEHLLESELFGYEKGAFTDATAKKEGLLELAEGGIVFLDELGKASKRIQAKILKAIEEKVIQRLGGKEPIPIDVRFLAAAQKKDLEEFLPDLKFRMGYPDKITLMTLNERISAAGKTIIEQSFINVLKKMGYSDWDIVIAPEAMEKLMNHQYKGNYRELENILRAAIISAKVRGKAEIGHVELAVIDTGETGGTTANALSSAPAQNIKLTDIFDYARAVSSNIVEEKIREIVRSGKNLKMVYAQESGSVRDYQLFWKKIKQHTGKGIREIIKG